MALLGQRWSRRPGRHGQPHAKIARVCSKERTLSGFVLAQPLFLPLTHPHISSRAKRLVAIFKQLTMPLTGLVLLTKLRWVSLLLRGDSSGGVPHHGTRRPLSPSGPGVVRVSGAGGRKHHGRRSRAMAKAGTLFTALGQIPAKTDVHETLKPAKSLAGVRVSEIVRPSRPYRRERAIARHRLYLFYRQGIAAHARAAVDPQRVFPTCSGTGIIWAF